MLIGDCCCCSRLLDLFSVCDISKSIKCSKLAVPVFIKNNWNVLKESVEKERRTQAIEKIDGILDNKVDLYWDKIMDLDNTFL